MAWKWYRQRQSYDGLNQWFFPFSKRNTQRVYWLLKLIFTSESYRFRVPHILSEYKSEMDGERPRRQSGEKKIQIKITFTINSIIGKICYRRQPNVYSRDDEVENIWNEKKKKTAKKVLPSRAACIISRQLVRITIVYGQTSHYSIFMMIRATVWISNDFCYDANQIDAAKCTHTHRPKLDALRSLKLIVSVFCFNSRGLCVCGVWPMWHNIISIHTDISFTFGCDEIRKEIVVLLSCHRFFDII